jgi:hypothetical protein
VFLGTLPRRIPNTIMYFIVLGNGKEGGVTFQDK